MQRLRRSIAISAATIMWLTPFDAVTPTGLSAILRLGVLALLVILIAVSLADGDRTMAVGAAAALGWSILQTALGRPIGGVGTLAIVILGGYAVGKIQWSGSVRTLFLPLLVAAALCVVQWLLQDNVYDRLFDAAPRFAPGQGFRARGALGHPLPTAALLTAVGVGALAGVMQSASAGRIRYASALVLLLGMVWLTTGTRSAPIVAALALIGGIVLSRVPRYRRGLAWGAYSIVHVLLAVTATATLVHILTSGTTMSVPRVLRFADLTNDSSYTSRSDGATLALEVLRSSECGKACLVAGHGYRALGDRLELDRQRGYIAAVDNMYLTVIYDFGLLAAALPIVVTVRAIRKRELGQLGPFRPAVAAAILTLVIFGFVFDIFYWTSCAFAFGVALGLLSLPRDRGALETYPGSVMQQHSSPAPPETAALPR